MSTSIFEVISMTDAEVSVRHIGEGHLYTIPFGILDGKRVLGTGTMRSNGSAKHGAECFEADAVKFSEMRAREHGKID